jgi:hypothetical protein
LRELPVARDTLLLRLLGVLEAALAVLPHGGDLDQLSGGGGAGGARSRSGGAAPSTRRANRVLKQAIAELKALPAEGPERMLALPILVRLRLEISAEPRSERTTTRSFSWIPKTLWRPGGRKRSIVRSLVHIYQSGFGTMPDELRSVIEDTHDEATLYAWLKLAGTRSADDVAAAILAARAI